MNCAEQRRRVVLAALAGVVVTLAVGLPAAVALLGSGPLSPPGQVRRVEAVPTVSVAAVTRIAKIVYVVQPGDTLWRLARTLQPTGDVRALVDRLSAQRRGRPLRPGELVTLR